MDEGGEQPKPGPTGADDLPDRPKWLTETLFLGFATVLAYAMTINYNVGYTSALGIPQEFVQWDAVQMTKVVALHLVSLFGMTWMLRTFFRILNIAACASNERRRMLPKWLFWCIGAFLSLLVWGTILGVFSLLPLGIGCVFAISLPFMPAVAGRLALPHWVKVFFEKLNQEEPSMRYGYLVFASVLTIVLYFGAERHGRQEATVSRVLPSWESVEGKTYTLIYRSGDYFIGKAEQVESSDDHQFVVVPLESLNGFRGVQQKPNK